MSKIRELINFEKVKDVIDIDAISDNREMVEKYVISPSMEEHLVNIFDDLKKGTHKAPQIIGGYGSGKSHLLAFIITILNQPEMAQHIKNDKVRERAENLNRDFALIHWELQPNEVSLSAYFYDRLELQLYEKYGIEYIAPESGVIDHKREILKVLDLIKQNDPARGLVVVVDEISDFLKQKRTKGEITEDVQFLRILGQVSQESDFVFIGSMQEHVFTNPKYIDEAESFGRVAERFNVITIKREDIKKVIAERVLAKTKEQRMQLEELFKEYTKHFQALRANLDEYIDLFPLHPYVIQVFSELPYFEKRGVIQFTIQEVEKILDEEFPSMITYDLIFNEIMERHTIKNLEDVSPVVEAVQTLDSKIDLLDKHRQETAKRIVNALGVLKLYGQSTNNGATLEELSNTLLILPANKLVEARDELALVLNNLRKVTDGQFINKTEGGYYYLDLSLDIDYDQVIQRRADNLPGGSLEEEILSILKEQLMLENGSENGVFLDTCRWSNRKSFREGTFVFVRSNDYKKETLGDYLIVFLSPFAQNNPYKVLPGTIVISSKLDQTTVDELKQVVAARMLANENFHRSIMQKKYVEIKKAFKEKLVKAYLEEGQVETEKGTSSVKSLISREFHNFDELLSEIKPVLLEDYFAQKYPKHPRFSQAITRDNIKGEFSSALQELFNKGSQQQSMFASAKSILRALELIDEQGSISTAKSEAAQKIRDLAKENQGKNVDVKQIQDEFSESPYGYDPLMTALVIIVLTYNGEIALKAAGGKTITSSEVEEVFTSGIDAFSNIHYLTLESDFNIQPVIDLFNVLGLSTDKLRKSAKRSEAVQQFRTCYLEIKEQFEQIDNQLSRLSIYASEIVDIDGLKQYHAQLEVIPLEDFEKVKTPNDFKKVAYEQEKIKNIGEAYQLLKRLSQFYEFYSNNLSKEVEYAREVNKIINAYPSLFDTDDIKPYIDEAFAILKDSARLLEQEELNPLLGKLQQAHKKYTSAYYNAHEKYVGSKVDWERLAEISKGKEYNKLKALKNISILNKHAFIKLEDELSKLGSLRCPDFKADLLEEKVICSTCEFPRDFPMIDIDQKTEKIEEKVAKILDEWEAELLQELQNYQDNIAYLTAEEQSLVQEVFKNSTLPEEITDDLVKALNNLFKEIEIVEVTPQEVIDRIFTDARVLDHSTLTKRLESFKHSLFAGRDVDRVRIKLTEGDE